MQPVTRFAPSPTGPLHLGHAYSALLAHDFARSGGGAFLLRIEDIDQGRARPEHVDGILADLLWLGLGSDGEIVYQSERLDLYRDALATLRSDDLVYPCFCTRAEIEREIGTSALAAHEPAERVYPGTCRRLSAERRRKWLTERPHAWRLDVAAACAKAGPLRWTDHGVEIIADPSIFGDVVLGRKELPASYHLAVTIDDAAQGITDVVRGNDLFLATHVHRLLQALLSLPTPAYHHHPLVADSEGRRLAKRAGSPRLADLREAGVDPKTLVAGLRCDDFPTGYSLLHA